MSQLEDMLSEQKHLNNKGHSVDQIQCAALMVIANELPNITFELGQLREQIIGLEMSVRGNN